MTKKDFGKWLNATGIHYHHRIVRDWKDTEFLEARISLGRALLRLEGMLILRRDLRQLRSKGTNRIFSLGIGLYGPYKNGNMTSGDVPQTGMQPEPKPTPKNPAFRNSRKPKRS